jgi:hypothetical protein
LFVEITPLTSVLAKIKTERVAAGEGDPVMRQKWPEVYTGDGAVVQILAQELREVPRMTLTFYYVLRWPWRVPVHDQAREIGLKVREFWRQLEIAEVAVDTGLAVMRRMETVKTRGSALRTPAIS